MSEAGDQRAFFRTTERDYWASAQALKPDERAVIQRHLDPAGETLEAGTGGGRILREMRGLGFQRLTGFDFAPELIAAAREQDASSSISFDVADASDLPYENESFDQILYLQQIVCTIEAAAGRSAALAEAARILRPGGVALFSFLCLEARERSRSQGAFLAYLRLLRRARGVERSPQLMPRLRLRGRMNRDALRDAGPYAYWYRVAEAEDALRQAGFEIRGLACAPDAAAGREHGGAAELLAGGELDPTLYAICGKR